jgi:alcohol dehydrogenase (NADP+)
MCFISANHRSTPLFSLAIPQLLSRPESNPKTKVTVPLAWAVQHGTALLTTPRTQPARGRISTSPPFPEEALDEINRIQTRQRFNEVVKTGSQVSFHKVDDHARRTNT